MSKNKLMQLGLSDKVREIEESDELISDWYYSTVNSYYLIAQTGCSTLHTTVLYARWKRGSDNLISARPRLYNEHGNRDNDEIVATDTDMHIVL